MLITGQGHDEELEALWKDFNRFMALFNPVISQSASHLYISALPFTPRKSKTYLTYAPQFPNLLQLKTGYLDYWPAGLGALEGIRAK